MQQEDRVNVNLAGSDNSDVPVAWNLSPSPYHCKSRALPPHDKVQLLGALMNQALLAVVRPFGTDDFVDQRSNGLVWLVDIRRLSCGAATADVGKDLTRISGFTRSLKRAVGRVDSKPSRLVPSIERKWCARQDSNLWPPD
jgi:hypothetical protein